MVVLCRDSATLLTPMDTPLHRKCDKDGPGGINPLLSLIVVFLLLSFLTLLNKSSCFLFLAALIKTLEFVAKGKESSLSSTMVGQSQQEQANKDKVFHGSEALV